MDRGVLGVGPRLAEAVVLYLDDPNRFASAAAVASYAGLVPRQIESGTMRRFGHITGRGPGLLRSLLVEAAWTVYRCHDWAKAFVDRDWTDKVLQYLSDAMPEEQLLASVEKTNRLQQAAQICEGWYFIAEKKKRAGDQAGATAAYQKAIESGATQLSAYRGAQMSLRAN